MTDKKIKDEHYSISVWDVTFYLVDKETDEPAMNDDGIVREFHADQHIDCSNLIDGLTIDDLEEVTIHNQIITGNK
jgi:hypothetical protein|tara:strand:+ start:1809 stop:2036 length:228 start_codon:yes stop_codon:yes gene_type:complete